MWHCGLKFWIVYTEFHFFSILAKPCGHPGEAAFADFALESADDFVFGSKVVYTCHNGYDKWETNHVLVHVYLKICICFLFFFNHTMVAVTKWSVGLTIEIAWQGVGMVSFPPVKVGAGVLFHISHLNIFRANWLNVMTTDWYDKCCSSGLKQLIKTSVVTLEEWQECCSMEHDCTQH